MYSREGKTPSCSRINMVNLIVHIKASVVFFFPNKYKEILHCKSSLHFWGKNGSVFAHSMLDFMTLIKTIRSFRNIYVNSLAKIITGKYFLCPRRNFGGILKSNGPSVRPSVCPSVRPSVTNRVSAISHLLLEQI